MFVAQIAEIIHEHAFKILSRVLRPFQMSTEWSQRRSNKEIKEQRGRGTTNCPTLQDLGALNAALFPSGAWLS